jgi:hypothetical protein
MIKGRRSEWSPELQALLDRSLQKITERFPQTIRMLAVSLEDVNGPRGGVDNRCGINMTLEGSRKVSVSACASNAAAAVIHATRRARNALISTTLASRRRRLRYSRSDLGGLELGN